MTTLGACSIFASTGSHTAAHTSHLSDWLTSLTVCSPVPVCPYPCIHVAVAVAVCAGEEAAALEAALGVAVLRHREKKPSGGKGEVEAHFGCGAHEVVMVGDR